MNTVISITEGIYWVGVNDRKTDLFESLWPIPRGVAYNSYLIDDEKIALVDTVKAPFQMDYLEKIRQVIGEREVAYLIINHMEPDHSGSIRFLKEMYPGLRVVGNKKTIELLHEFYGITDDVHVVGDGDTLPLGRRTLSFHLTPMVHWPETMMTYDAASGMLFAGDAFGSYGTLDGGIFDDELDAESYHDETLRYFANIVAKYSPMVLKAVEKLADIDIKIIGATHGLVWRKDPKKIVDKYVRWSRQEPEKGVVIAFGSMYGNTEKMADEIARALAENGVEKVIVCDAARTHLSYLLMDIWRYRGLILGSCTYNMKLFPPMEQLIGFLENDGIKNHVLGIFGGFTWSGGAVKRLNEFAEKTKLETVAPVIEAKCSPKENDLAQCRELARAMAERIK